MCFYYVLINMDFFLQMRMLFSSSENFLKTLTPFGDLGTLGLQLR